MDSIPVNIADRVLDLTIPQINSLIDDLHDSVAEYRNPESTVEDRIEIRTWWDTLGVKNQFHATITASRLKRILS